MPPDGTSHTPEAIHPYEIVLPLPKDTPAEAISEILKASAEIAQMGVKPKFTTDEGMFSFLPEILLSNAFLIDHMEEIKSTFGLSTEAFNDLFVVNNVDDLAKLGSNPESVIHRLYFEARLTKIHTKWMQENFNKVEPLLDLVSPENKAILEKGVMDRSIIPLKAALFIIAEEAKVGCSPKCSAEIDQIFTLTNDDSRFLAQEPLKMNPDTPFGVFMTTAHTVLAPSFLRKLGMSEKVIELAPSHHLSSGLQLIPEETIAKFGLDGNKSLDPVFIRQAAILEYLDKVFAFASRNKPPLTLSESLAISHKVINANLASNHKDSLHFQAIKDVYEKTFTFLEASHLTQG